MTRLLVIDSDAQHGQMLSAALRESGFVVDLVPHDRALAVLTAGTTYDTLIVRVTPQPSTLSADHRLGEFVLHYIAQLAPDLLERTIVLTTISAGERRWPPVGAVLEEPFALTVLLARIGRER